MTPFTFHKTEAFIFRQEHGDCLNFFGSGIAPLLQFLFRFYVGVRYTRSVTRNNVRKRIISILSIAAKNICLLHIISTLCWSVGIISTHFAHNL